VLLSLVLAFLVGEVAVRLTYGVIEPKAYFLPGLYKKEPRPLGWSALPRYEGLAVDQFSAVPTTTNELGMRDPPFTKARAEAARRILFLGDSITFGGGVPDGETFPNLVETILAREQGRGTVACFNAGVPAYDTVQELAMLERVGSTIRPHAVVLGWYRNDVWVPSDEVDVQVIDGYLTDDEKKLRKWQARHIQHRDPLRWSALVRFSEIQWKNWRYPAKVKRVALEWQARGGRGADPESVARCRKAVLGIAAWCRANEARLLVVLFPAREESEVDGAPEPRLTTEMAEFLRREAIPVLSLQPAWVKHWERTRESLFLANDRCHMARNGHAFVADEIARAVRGLWSP
jgi:lysophospholipase L1-like esterase